MWDDILEQIHIINYLGGSWGLMKAPTALVCSFVIGISKSFSLSELLDGDVRRCIREASG